MDPYLRRIVRRELETRFGDNANAIDRAEQLLDALHAERKRLIERLAATPAGEPTETVTKGPATP